MSHRESYLESSGKSILERKSLERATIVGIILQATLAILGHFTPWVRNNASLFGGMMTSAMVGYLYALGVSNGYGPGALGGTLAGGTCAVIGIAISIMLGDSPMTWLIVGTLICALTGAIGGIFGQMAANLRKLR